MTDYQEILDDRAPCGLSCRKCFANRRGDIATLSTELRQRLGSFGIYAERFSAFLPAFKDYPAFEGLLSYLAEGHCDGCRQGTCLYPNCGVSTCYQEQGVDFSEDQLRPASGAQVAPDERAHEGDRGRSLLRRRTCPGTCEHNPGAGLFIASRDGAL
jgi:hypothetical protein